jgi:dihydropteroate synthase type 2
VPQPRLVGIVNVTEDSFSDGGRYLDPERAVVHALELAAGGADVVELGAASSHPDARPVSPEGEIARLEPVVARLQDAGLTLCIDSFAAPTQRWALARGVDWINDIQGFPDPGLYPELAAARCRLVVMHAVQGRGIAQRRTTEPQAVFDGLIAFFEARLTALAAAGIAQDRIVLDPGMGFFLGDNPETSLHVLRRLEQLKRHFGRELLVSVSRKSFLGALTGRPVAERLPATLAAELFAAAHGADWIRTHDVRALRDALRITTALTD